MLLLPYISSSFFFLSLFLLSSPVPTSIPYFLLPTYHLPTSIPSFLPNPNSKIHLRITFSDPMRITKKFSGASCIGKQVIVKN